MWPPSHARLSHLAQASRLLQKAVGDDEILSPRCSSPDVRPHEGPGRGERWTGTGQVQRGRRPPCPHTGVKFQPRQGEERRRGAGRARRPRRPSSRGLPWPRLGVPRAWGPSRLPSHWLCVRPSANSSRPVFFPVLRGDAKSPRSLRHRGICEKFL